VKVLSKASRSGYLICPACEVGRLHPSGGGFARCERCGYVLDAKMLLPLERIVALPEVLGKHACECGHPEMRLLPDGVYHCPNLRFGGLAVEVPSACSRDGAGPTAGAPGQSAI
jgi:hypothetical protein